MHQIVSFLDREMETLFKLSSAIPLLYSSLFSFYLSFSFLFFFLFFYLLFSSIIFSPAFSSPILFLSFFFSSLSLSFLIFFFLLPFRWRIPITYESRRKYPGRRTTKRSVRECYRGDVLSQIPNS